MSWGSTQLSSNSAAGASSSTACAALPSLSLITERISGNHRLFMTVSTGERAANPSASFLACAASPTRANATAPDHDADHPLPACPEVPSDWLNAALIFCRASVEL